MIAPGSLTRIFKSQALYADPNFIRSPRDLAEKEMVGVVVCVLPGRTESGAVRALLVLNDGRLCWSFAWENELL